MNYAIESMDLTDFIQTDMKRNIRQKIPGTEKVLFRDHRTVNVVSFSSDLQYGQFWTLPVEFFLLSSLQGPLKFHFVKNAVHSFFRKQQHSLNMASCLTRFFHCPFLQGSAAYLIWFCQFLSASDHFSSHHSSSLFITSSARRRYASAPADLVSYKVIGCP